MIYQQWNVFRAFPQGWNVNRKNIQPVKQIFAKFLLLNHLSEVAIGGCDQAGIGVNSPCASQPLEFSLLEHTQQLGLQLDGNIPDLVEEYRAAVRQLEAADALCDGAGERAFFVTEQLAFKQACSVWPRSLLSPKSVRGGNSDCGSRGQSAPCPYPFLLKAELWNP